ncbi:MAG: putative DNA binding domain-containing protein [Flavobacteriales bacterium]|nr:putative DNA binding domain-containing protein [Flavobacteriales bacterium]
MAESQNIEWKQSWRDEYLKWICGFANAKGGKIFIGKDDSGNVVGVENYKRLMDDIPNKIIAGLGLVCEVNLYQEADKYYIEIDVQPHDVPISYHGKYHFRSGSTKQELQGTSLNEFLLRKTGKTWDDVIEPSASLEDIDEKAVGAFKRGAVKSGRLPQVEDENDIHQIFENLRLTKDGKLKRAAVLLFGKDPRNLFINAYVKIGKFGKSDDDLLSQEVIESNAFELANQTLEILDKKYFTKSISYDGLHRIETTEYPYEAIRETLLNAIVHRQYLGAPIQISLYDDKIMIWNYGTLPEPMTLEDLKHKHASHPRNPILADVFFKGGLIESWGRGTLKIIDECRSAGLPIPEIAEMTGGIIVTIYKDVYNEKLLATLDLNERQLEALLLWKSKGEIITTAYSEKFDIGDRTARRDIIDLVEKGLLIKTGDLKTSKYLYKGRSVQ